MQSFFKWDMERMWEANASNLVIIGIILGTFVWVWLYLISLLVGVFLLGRRTDYFPSAQASAGRVVIGIILFWKPGQILPDQHLISILNLLHLTECHIFKGQLQTFASQPGYFSVEILNRIRNGLGHS